MDDLVGFVNKEIGTNFRVAKPASAVWDLDPSNFDKVVSDPTKHKLVEFYAPWCGHCKQLAPKYEKVASAFETEENVIVAKVDADKHRSLGERFSVTGFPTIKYFPADSRPLDEIVQAYDGPREADAIVEFLNQKAGTQRAANGALAPTAGRLHDFDDLAAEFLAASDKAALFAEAQELASSYSGKQKGFADTYVKVMAKIIEKGAEYVAKETARLEGMIASPNIAKAKKDDFSIRKNVLAAFSGRS